MRVVDSLSKHNLKLAIVSAYQLSRQQWHSILPQKNTACYDRRQSKAKFLPISPARRTQSHVPQADSSWFPVIQLHVEASLPH